jgi:hypothetical protein
MRIRILVDGKFIETTGHVEHSPAPRMWWKMTAMDDAGIEFQAITKEGPIVTMKYAHEDQLIDDLMQMRPSVESPFSFREPAQ